MYTLTIVIEKLIILLRGGVRILSECTFNTFLICREIVSGFENGSLKFMVMMLKMQACGENCLQLKKK